MLGQLYGLGLFVCQSVCTGHAALRVSVQLGMRFCAGPGGKALVLYCADTDCIGSFVSGVFAACVCRLCVDPVHAVAVGSHSCIAPVGASGSFPVPAAPLASRLQAVAGAVPAYMRYSGPFFSRCVVH